MTRFHTDEYIEFLAKVTPENFRKLTFSGTRFLVDDDNPAFEGVFEFSSISAGGSIGTLLSLRYGCRRSVLPLPSISPYFKMLSVSCCGEGSARVYGTTMRCPHLDRVFLTGACCVIACVYALDAPFLAHTDIAPLQRPRSV